MDLLFACLKLGLFGFVVGHLLLLYAIYWAGKRYPGSVRAFGRRVALLLIGPEMPPPPMGVAA